MSSPQYIPDWCWKFSLACLLLPAAFFPNFALVARAQTPVYNLPPEQRLSPEVVRSLQDAAEARRRQDSYEHPDLRPEEPAKPVNPMQRQQAEELARENADKSIKTVVLPPAAFQSLADHAANRSAGAGTEPKAFSTGPHSFWYTGVMTILVIGGAFLVARKLYRIHE